MKVWLVGAKGMLGTALAGRLEARGVRLVATDRELDIANGEQVTSFARREKPTHVINAAAYTRVDDAETHEDEAFAANALGPENLGRAAAELGASVVHFSTDYVFAGAARDPYTESAPTGPTSAYGRTKLAGEERLLAAAPGAYVIRTSWLFGENGPSFPRTIAKLCLERDELRVVADQIGRPTYTGDLADAALALAGLAGRAPAAGGIYHFANAGIVSWHELAVRVREHLVELGRPVKASRVMAITTAEFPRPAPRPAYSVLDTSRIEAALGRAPRSFDEPLSSFLATL